MFFIFAIIAICMGSYEWACLWFVLSIVLD
jgi:hypothetical protein